MSDAPTPHVMLTVGEIAERDGLSKQAVSAAVKKLVDDYAIPVERDVRGRVARVSYAHWQRHRSHFTNPAKRLSAAGGDSPSPSPGGTSSSFEEARRQNEWLKVDAARLEQQERSGDLVRADKLKDAISQIGRAIGAIVTRLPNRADDLALAVGREGVHGLRMALRTVALDMANQFADELEKLGQGAPEYDPRLNEDGEN